MDLIQENNHELLYEGKFFSDEIGVWWYNFKLNKSIDNAEYIIPKEDGEGSITEFLDQMLPMKKILAHNSL